MKAKSRPTLGTAPDKLKFPVVSTFILLFKEGAIDKFPFSLLTTPSIISLAFRYFFAFNTSGLTTFLTSSNERVPSGITVEIITIKYADCSLKGSLTYLCCYQKPSQLI